MVPGKLDVHMRNKIRPPSITFHKDSIQMDKKKKLNLKLEMPKAPKENLGETLWNTGGVATAFWTALHDLAQLDRLVSLTGWIMLSNAWLWFMGNEWLSLLF